MFKDLNLDINELGQNTKDEVVANGQHECCLKVMWNALLNGIPGLRAFLGVFALKLDLGGMHHKGKRYFAIEVTGLVYLFAYLILWKYDV